MDDILAKVDQMAMVKKYDEHIASGNWQRADDTLKAFFETCDLRSVATESLARTGLPSSVLRVIKNRAEDGEDGAASILALAKAHLGTTRDAAAQEGESGPVKEDKGFEGKPQDYPPERFDALLADMRTGKSFDAHYYLPRWFEYWEKAGRGC